MKSLLKQLPYPISGLMLGLASLGNLLNMYHPLFRVLFGGLSLIIFIALLAKMFTFPISLKEGYENPVIASILSTFPMSMIILSTYFSSFAYAIAFGIWRLGVALMLTWVIFFTRKHVMPFKIEKVFSSYFVLYVGVVVASLTAPIYGVEALGRILFWYGFFIYLLLVPIVTYRVFVVKGIPEPLKPLVIIYAAPASRLLAGYLQSFSDKSVLFVLLLGGWAFLMTLFGLSQMPRLLRQPFYPSYSAFTFPFVISAVAFNGLTNFLKSEGYATSFIEPIRIFFILWASIMVVYVLVRYLLFLSKTTLKKYSKL